ncbi:MAG: DUF1307 domain-containing protein [Bacilli bacterium]|nr:DUF1307 domain-containing protein [Bacilli bacterium]
MKKGYIFLLIGIVLLTLTGCETKEEKETPVKKGRVHEHCTRVGIIDNNSSADLSYEIYYTGEVLNRIESTEKVTSTSQETLDTYENAYRGIHEHYKGLKYYETNVVRTNDTVTSTIVIDYDYIDIDQLISIEGESNNVFENKVPKVAKWKELADRVGTKCTEVA